MSVYPTLNMSDPKGHVPEWYSFDDLETHNVLLVVN